MQPRDGTPPTRRRRAPTTRRSIPCASTWSGSPRLTGSARSRATLERSPALRAPLTASSSTPSGASTLPTTRPRRAWAASSGTTCTMCRPASWRPARLEASPSPASKAGHLGEWRIFRVGDRREQRDLRGVGPGLIEQRRGQPRVGVVQRGDQEPLLAHQHVPSDALLVGQASPLVLAALPFPGQPPQRRRHEEGRGDRDDQDGRAREGANEPQAQAGPWR